MAAAHLAHVSIPRDSSGIWVRARLTTEDDHSFLGGFFSSNNHLAPDNTEGMVHIGADAPVYWTVELKRDP